MDVAVVAIGDADTAEHTWVGDNKDSIWFYGETMVFWITVPGPWQPWPHREPFSDTMGWEVPLPPLPL